MLNFWRVVYFEYHVKRRNCEHVRSLCPPFSSASGAFTKNLHFESLYSAVTSIENLHCNESIFLSVSLCVIQLKGRTILCKYVVLLFFFIFI